MRALKVSVTALFVFLLGFIIVPVLIAEASAESANLAVHWDTVSMVLDSDADDTSTDPGETGHGDIIFGGASGITPVDNNLAESGSSYGRLVVTKKRIGVATSGTYFSVYVSMADSSNSLIMDNTNLELEATSGTWDTPATFITNGGSGWGYAVPGTMIPRSSTVATAPDFSTSIASASILDQQLAYNTEGAATYYANSVWAAVPERNTPQLVWKESNTSNDNYGFGTYTVTNNGVSTQVVSPHSDANDTRYKSFDIYYAVAVDTNVVAGTYSNQIVYTGMAAASSLDTVSTNLVRDIEFGGQNDVQTLRFDLNDSAASIAQNQITVALVPHATFVQNGYTIDNLTLTDYDTCTITDFTRNTVEGYSELTCTMPEETPETGYGNGTFDYWVNIGGYNYNYVSKIQNTVSGDTVNVGAFVYAGLQSQYATATVAVDDGNGGTTNVALDNRSGTIVKEMQEMTPGICDLTNMWKNTTSVDARIMDYNGLVELESTAVDSDALGVGTFALSDNRDDKDYLVRRLADGNCWMVQNLDLELADFAGTQKLTPANTDINTEGKIYWDPSESVTLGEKTIEDGSQFASSSAQGGRWVSKYNENVENGIYLGTGDLLDPNNLDGSSMPSNRSWLDLQQTSRNNTAYYNTDHLWVEENRNSQAPRSISNGLAWLDNSDPTVITVETTYNVEDDGEPSSSSWYKGSWYNWYAATAESGTFETSNSSASDSICSKNWMLPTTYDSLARKSLQNLLSSYSISRSNNATLKENPIAMVTSGEYSLYYGTFFLTGVHMSFWTSKASSNTNSIAFSNYSNVLNIDENGRKNRGFSIRCVNKGSNQETVVSTCAANSICYNSNGGSGSVETQTVEASETTATLASASALSRDGYVFAGWSTAPSGYGDIFGQNTETTVGDLTTSGLQLYAKWVKPELTMQGFTSARCSIMEENQKISLIDTRDSKIYGAIKLGDGECWMADDLAYTGSDGSYVTEYNDKIYYRANRFASKNPCPGGWSVPTKTQADAMLPYYENLSLSAVGGYYHGSIHNYEAAAFYWTSTPQTGGTLWYSISVRQTNVPIVSPGYGSDAGMFVRCIAQ